MGGDAKQNETEGVFEDVPLGNLPLSNAKIIFDQHCIDLVALEIRWLTPLGNIEEGTAVQIRDTIEERINGLRLQTIERVEQRSLTVVLDEATLPSQPEVEYGHILRTDDQKIAVSILPHSLGIQLGEYERWSITVRPLLEAALTAITDVLNPGLLARIGLRYVNRIHDESCTSAQDWIGKISAALVAPYSDWGMRSWVRTAREQIEFSIDQDHAAVLRHGVLSPNEYLIDIDIFSQRTLQTNTDDLVRRFTQMNRTALANFQQSIVVDYLLSRQSEGFEG